MQLFLDEVAARHADDNIVVVLDGAGWHTSNALHPPENMRLPFPPPSYSPELNPVEHLWDGAAREALPQPRLRLPGCR